MAFEYVPYEGPVVTRAEAREAGEKRYFLGVPCQNGHLSERYVAKSGCVACCRLKLMNWRIEDRERARASNRAWKAANADKVKVANAALFQRKKEIYAENGRKWRKANPEKRRALEKRFMLRHPETARVKNAARMARIRACKGRYTAQDVKDLFARQSGKCAHSWCRASLKKKYHVDHITPLARGGDNDRKNLQLLCPPCNQSKNAKDPIAWAQQNGLLL